MNSDFDFNSEIAAALLGGGCRCRLQKPKGIHATSHAP